MSSRALRWSERESHEEFSAPLSAVFPKRKAQRAGIPGFIYTRQQTAAKAADHHRKGEHPTAISVHKTITLNLETGRRKCPSRPASQDREQTSSKTRIRAPHWLTTDDSPVCLLLPRPHQGDFTRTLNRSHFAQTSPDNKGRKHQHAHVT